MFGWEFPPHISGGLGTACFGLTKGLSELDGMEITFVVPKAWGDETPSDVQLIGANQVPLTRHQIELSGEKGTIDYLEVTGKHPSLYLS